MLGVLLAGVFASAAALPDASMAAPRAADAPAGPAQSACGATLRAELTGDRLRILGSDAVDEVRLRYDAASQAFEVFVPPAAGLPTWRLDASGVLHIEAQLCDGDDLLVLDDSGGSRLADRWAIEVDAGAGNDVVFGGLDLGSVALPDALQMIATLRTAGDLVQATLGLLDASPGDCETAPCLAAAAADLARAAGEELALPAAHYLRDVEPQLVQPSAATVREAQARIGDVVTTTISRTASAYAVEREVLPQAVDLAVDEVELLLPTAAQLLTDTIDLQAHAASLGLEVQSRDPVRVFTSTIASHVASITTLSQLCEEEPDPDPEANPPGEDDQDPSGLPPACAELERRIEALEAATDLVGEDESPDSGAARLEAEGDAFAQRGDALEMAGEAFGDDEAPNTNSRAAQLAVRGEAIVADAEVFAAEAELMAADWEAWVEARASSLETAGKAMHARGQAELGGGGDALRGQAEAEVEAAAERLRARAESIQVELQALMAAAGPLLGGSGGLRLDGQLATSCSVTPANSFTGSAGDDTLLGTADSDLLDGGDGRDLLVGFEGDDRILGGAGQDLAFGGGGGDAIEAGADVDLLVGQDGADCLYGGGGQTLSTSTLSVAMGDIFVGGPDDDLIANGDGADDDPAEFDLAWGGSGADEIRLGHGGELEIGNVAFQLGNLAFGGDGADRIETADGFDLVFGEADDDTIQTGRGTAFEMTGSGGSGFRLALGDLIFGGAGDDSIDSDDPAADRDDDDVDLIFAMDGADTIRAYGGGRLSIGDLAQPSFEIRLGNLIFGGAGEDDIRALDGVDVVFAGADDDTVTTGQGDALDIAGSGGDSRFRLALGDLIFGEAGADTLQGDDPAADRDDDDIDVIFAGPDADTVRGYGGGMLSIGDASDPSVELRLGNLVFGGTGADDVVTLDGIDLVFGEEDGDRVQAGRGDRLVIDDDFEIDLGDLIFGQEGDDRLHGDASSPPTGGGSDGIDVIFGGPDDDAIYSGTGGDIEVPSADICVRFGNLLFGGPGDDLLRGDYEAWDPANPRGGIDLAFGADGDDTLQGAGGSVLFFGDLSSLQVVVIWFGNLLFGGRGDDRIEGGDRGDLSTCALSKISDWADANLGGLADLGGAADLIFAGPGADTVEAYDGIDLVFGGFGDDALHADDGGMIIVPIEGIPTPIHFGNLMFGAMGEDRITSKGRTAGFVVGQLEIDLLFGGPCADDIDAGDAFNLAFGGRADDVVRAGDGFNLLFGNAEDDAVTAGDGLTLAFGNAGDDVVAGGTDADGVFLLFGNAGDDRIVSGDGLTLAFGNRGDDGIQGGDGVGLLFGNAGRDEVVGGTGLTLAFGNRGSDRVRAGDGAALLFGNRDDDAVDCGAGLCVAFGNAGHDLVGAGAGLGALFGNAGEDRLTAGSGLGVAFGNTGADILSAGGGALLAFGGPDDDVLLGGSLFDIGFGNAGADHYVGGSGKSIFFGNSGPDTARGGGGDLLFGNRDNDVLLAGSQADVVFGNRGNDILGSNDGADLVFGNRGNDAVRAADGAGCDLLFGNRGDDVLDRCQDCDKRLGGRGKDSKSAGCLAVDPGALARGEVRGRVTIDLDGDATGDIGQAGVTVMAGSSSAVTDADGWYRIAGLAQGATQVGEQVPAGYVQISTPTAHAISVGSPGIDLFLQRDFVNRPRCAVSADGWGCVSGGCARGAAGVASACQPVAVRPVRRCASTGERCSEASDCPCQDCEDSWEVVTCDCLPPETGCRLEIDPVSGPRCVGRCASPSGAGCQLIRDGGVFRCGCGSPGRVFLPILLAKASPGEAGSPIDPTVTSAPTVTATVTPTPRSTWTPRSTATGTPAPLGGPLARHRRRAARAQAAGAPSGPFGPLAPAQTAVRLDGSWTVLDELMIEGAFFAPLYDYTSNLPVRIDLTDLFVVSDGSEVYLDGQPIGTTPATADWPALGSDPQAPPYTADPAVAWQEPAFGKASFALPAGTHRLTFRNLHIPARSAGGAPHPDGTLAFRLVLTEDPGVTPEPGCAPRPAGMVAWWPLDELAGAQAIDVIGGHTGTAEGAAVPMNPAKVLAGRFFDGGVVRVADAPGLDGGAAGLAVDAWVRPATLEGRRPIVAKRHAPTDRPLGWSLDLVDGRPSFRWDGPGGSIEATAPVTASVGAWHLLGLSLAPGAPDGGQLFLDGELVHRFDTSALTMPLDTGATLWIGFEPALGRGQLEHGFLGAIDEVELFDRPLALEALRAIFAADRLGKCDKPAPPTPGPTAVPTRATPVPTVPPAPLGADQSGLTSGSGRVGLETSAAKRRAGGSPLPYALEDRGASLPGALETIRRSDRRPRGRRGDRRGRRTPLVAGQVSASPAAAG
ncbi:MAG: hypothetical protein H6648_02880 [Caldilineae bacterium]|nr:hypothetical protein [Caldilineae bacterium]